MKTAVVTFTAIIFSVLMFFSHYGLFAQAHISEKEMGPFMLVYEKHVGDYSAAGVLMDEIHSNLMEKSEVKSAKAFGLYFDNPIRKENENLRCIVGCILGTKEKKGIRELGEKLEFNLFPASKSVVCEFPFEGKLSGLIGASRAYPKLIEYLELKGYNDVPIMEVYDTQKRKLYYVAPVALRPEFFNSYLK